MTDRFSEPDDEPIEPVEEGEDFDDSELSRLTPAARQCLDDARAALARSTGRPA